MSTKKFTIPMSDIPGSYKPEELYTALVHYFSQNLMTVRRIRDVLLPMCRKKPVVSRDELKDELARRGDPSEPGNMAAAVASISLQIGMEKNDFLRQVLQYEYSKISEDKREKDNYSIRAEYVMLIDRVLADTATSHSRTDA